ncbi:hypothetical protein KC19_3G162200 [Ceratodon purpureus]|uniref:Uncharacterized protein n=1 Tax=Ceratodon purpureus TaxID=3225 RepID=A0A8T0IMU8_CERPU|nr:hypothetical protein KC19_3G162200 [Ceratodon purpureus]
MAGKDAKKQRRKLFTDLLRVLKHVNRDGSSGQIAAVLEPWVLDIQEESSCLPEKLAIPLKGNYPMKGEHPKRHLSFEGLERKDRIVAEALRNCKDSDGHQLLDVFLCIVTLHRSGRAAPTYGERTYEPPPSWVPKSCYNPPSEDEDEASGEDYGHEIGEIDEQRLEGTMFRIDWNNKQASKLHSIILK